MDSLALITSSLSLNKSPICVFPARLLRRSLSGLGKPKFAVLASKDEPKLDKWDQMELKFGKLLGEDPKLTLYKIMGKKLNPEASYLEIEKYFYKKKGKMDIEEVPFDGPKEKQVSDSMGGLNLVCPVPKKEVKFNSEDKSYTPKAKIQNQSVPKPMDKPTRNVPKVILRKPPTYNEEDDEITKFSKLSMKPNLSLRMRNEQEKEKFSDMTLLRKPMPMTDTREIDKEKKPSGKAEERTLSEDELRTGKEVAKELARDFTLLKKPLSLSTFTHENQKLSSDEDADIIKESTGSLSESGGAANAPANRIEGSLGPELSSLSKETELEDDSLVGLQPLWQSDVGFNDKETAADESPDLVNPSTKFSMGGALLGKPKRLDQSVKEPSNSISMEMGLGNPKNDEDAVVEDVIATSPLQERENTDWSRAEYLVKTGVREEVELISCSTRGFVVSSGSLIGFLPYRNLSAKWKFLAFESWLRRKGLDPSLYRKNLGIVGSYEAANDSRDTITDPEIDQNIGEKISPNLNLNELLRIYDREKLKFLSSFVGQKIKVNVLMADRSSRKLIFSIKPKEKEELIERKKNLMAKLSVGDVVRCCIKKITYFGIFVEVEGVPALIHQTEVSWDSTLDPASYYKIGQIVEAKVHQLDFGLERIFLSLKEITPDPLIEALESVVDDRNLFDGNLEAAQLHTEWSDVESLIKELQQIDGVQLVSKGRFFLSPGLAPTFQVYMASMFENQYKLLARAGNKVQEVMVDSSLGKEEMKSAILACTNRVE